MGKIKKGRLKEYLKIKVDGSHIEPSGLILFKKGGRWFEGEVVDKMDLFEIYLYALNIELEEVFCVKRWFQIPLI